MSYRLSTLACVIFCNISCIRKIDDDTLVNILSGKMSPENWQAHLSTFFEVPPNLLHGVMQENNLTLEQLTKVFEKLPEVSQAENFKEFIRFNGTPPAKAEQTGAMLLSGILLILGGLPRLITGKGGTMGYPSILGLLSTSARGPVVNWIGWIFVPFGIVICLVAIPLMRGARTLNKEADNMALVRALIAAVVITLTIYLIFAH